MTYHIKDTISFDEIDHLVKNNSQLALSPEAEARIIKCKEYLDTKLAKNSDPIYGINTGFGSLCNTQITNDELGALQKNLIMSHACGMGDAVPVEIVKLMLLLKVQSLSYGHSGVQLATVNRLIDFYNKGIYPVIYQQGSLGASGDLAPLSHLSLPLFGEGEVYYNNTRMPSAEALKQAGLEPIELEAKEGLALINGTQFMSAYGVWCVMQAKKQVDWANRIAAMSLDAFECRTNPFYDKVHQIRNQKGQIAVAAAIRELLEGSEIAAQKKPQVQDPYSFRCLPQVHGASMDAIGYVEQIVLNEINAVTDNPNVFPDEDEIISAGNFHGQPLALVLDFLAIACAELASISERRTYLLISGQRGLPPFLAAKAGLNSGFMIPQYTAASIVSQNKQLCHPASVDSIPSSNGQEDHVSMGANAATKCYRVVSNTTSVLGIELLNSAQALEFRRPNKSSQAVEQLHADFRKVVPFYSEDQDAVMHNLMKKAAEFVS